MIMTRVIVELHTKQLMTEDEADEASFKLEYFEDDLKAYVHGLLESRELLDKFQVVIK